jgi:DNA mismatch repair ATPase MutS
VRGRFPDDITLFQVGAYYELYNRRDEPIATKLGLKPLKENRRRALYGIPHRLFGCYLARLLGLGRSVVVVLQGEQHWTGIRERVLVWRMVPAAA